MNRSLPSNSEFGFGFDILLRVVFGCNPHRGLKGSRKA